MKTILGILLIGVLSSCTTPPNPNPLPNPVWPDVHYDDGSISDVFQNSCGKACDNLAKLGCPEGDERRQGDSCITVCEHVMDTNIIVFDPMCIYNATTKSEVRLCPAIECPDEIH